MLFYKVKKNKNKIATAAVAAEETPPSSNIV